MWTRGVLDRMIMILHEMAREEETDSVRERERKQREVERE